MVMDSVFKEVIFMIRPKENDIEYRSVPERAKRMVKVRA